MNSGHKQSPQGRTKRPLRRRSSDTPERAGRRRRLRAGVVALAGFGLTAAMLTPSPAAADAKHLIKVGSVHKYDYPTDTPASVINDTDGTFYFQQSAALYGKDDPRYWEFYSGTDSDDATRSSAISDAVNPDNSKDRNNDTTWRCNHSPTGKESTKAPDTSGYSQPNYCDLVGTWVDPDTGHWYGVVHNEFTPQTFGSGLHYDSLDYAVSTDHGRTWKIKDHIVTSPHSTKRDDKSAFGEDTWDYGDGDPRLFVDQRSGYFYLYYGSRILNKAGTGDNTQSNLAHVARAPISKKMKPDSWHKFYNGSWDEPGVGGKESDMVPTDEHKSGYVSPAKDYDPKQKGTVKEQQKKGTLPKTSKLFLPNIAWNAYLGEYIGTPETDGKKPQPIYATKDLGTQKWHRIGTTGKGYKQDSWYRWMVDSQSASTQGLLGKKFRNYCSVNCATSGGEWANLTIDSSKPSSPVKEKVPYTIRSRSNQMLTQDGKKTTTKRSSHSDSASWRFTDNKDGSYTITNTDSGDALGVSSSGSTDRAWGTRPGLSKLSKDGPKVGQQWFVVQKVMTPQHKGETKPTKTYRLVNRYSGLTLSLAGDTSADTTPYRNWTNQTGNTTGGNRKGADQTLSLLPR